MTKKGFPLTQFLTIAEIKKMLRAYITRESLKKELSHYEQLYPEKKNIIQGIKNDIADCLKIIGETEEKRLERGNSHKNATQGQQKTREKNKRLKKLRFAS